MKRGEVDPKKIWAFHQDLTPALCDEQMHYDVDYDGECEPARLTATRATSRLGP